MTLPGRRELGEETKISYRILGVRAAKPVRFVRAGVEALGVLQRRSWRDPGDAKLRFLGRGVGIMASGVLEVPANMCRILCL